MGRRWDVAVIGGGPAGLAAATLAALRGKSSVLLERGSSMGGRAVSTCRDGAYLNLGPHAFYRHGAAQRVLDLVGVTVNGGAPGMNISWLCSGDEVTSTAGLLFGKKLTWSEKIRLIRTLLAIRKVKPADQSGMSWDQFLASSGVRGRAADILKAMARLGTYAGDTSRLDAGMAVMQLQKATLYPDGGWQSIVDSLVERAQDTGVDMLTDASVTAVRQDRDGWLLEHRSGSLVARSVIVAADPKLLQGLFGPWLPERYADILSSLESVEAACLDVHLRKLPIPSHSFALGIDEPVYMSVHSRWARLADAAEEAVVHVMRYDGVHDQGPAATKESLMKLLDRMQPGWRQHIISERFMPSLTVMHARPVTSQEGTSGRPPVETGIPGVYVAGDWVGDEGLLLDASLASAERAAELVIAT